jgi:predicted hotdog family 3-hydroxylacyl-ACP dehydratase
VLVSSILEHEPDATTCLITVREAFPLRFEGGLVPALLGLEYMAQSIAIHGGLRARSEALAAPVGLLLGAVEVDLRTDGFSPGQRLEVTVRRLWGDRAFFIFDCRLRDHANRAMLMTASLKVFRSRGANDDR